MHSNKKNQVNSGCPWIIGGILLLKYFTVIYHKNNMVISTFEIKDTSKALTGLW